MKVGGDIKWPMPVDRGINALEGCCGGSGGAGGAPVGWAGAAEELEAVGCSGWLLGAGAGAEPVAVLLRLGKSQLQ